MLQKQRKKKNCRLSMFIFVRMMAVDYLTKVGDSFQFFCGKYKLQLFFSVGPCLRPDNGVTFLLSFTFIFNIRILNAWFAQHSFNLPLLPPSTRSFDEQHCLKQWRHVIPPHPPPLQPLLLQLQLLPPPQSRVYLAQRFTLFINFLLVCCSALSQTIHSALDDGYINGRLSFTYDSSSCPMAVTLGCA